MSTIASPGQLRAGYVRWALVFVPLIVLLGLLSGKLSGSGAADPWFAALEKPDVYPPAAAFGIVWSLLYALMGFALAMVVNAQGAVGRGLAIAAFGVQLVLNLAWSPVFFVGHQLSGALVLLVLLDIAVIVTIALFWRVRAAAALLLLPYLAWILFATYLNWAILDANPQLDGSKISGAVQRFEI